MLKILRLILGAILILIGLPGLILPIIPGTVLILAGIIILSADLPFFDRIIVWIEKRYPKLGRAIKKARKTLRKHS